MDVLETMVDYEAANPHPPYGRRDKERSEEGGRHSITKQGINVRLEGIDKGKSERWGRESRAPGVHGID